LGVKDALIIELVSQSETWVRPREIRRGHWRLFKAGTGPL